VLLEENADEPDYDVRSHDLLGRIPSKEDHVDVLYSRFVRP